MKLINRKDGYAYDVEIKSSSASILVDVVRINNPDIKYSDCYFSLKEFCEEWMDAD